MILVQMLREFSVLTVDGLDRLEKGGASSLQVRKHMALFVVLLHHGLHFKKSGEHVHFVG